MDIPFSKWYPAIFVRRSRRHYDPSKIIPDNLLDILNRVCDEFRPFPSVRAKLVTGCTEDVFKGIVGSYGKIRQARNFIAFIADTRDENFQEKVGYTGEGIILEATALSLSTCWVAGFFKPDVVASIVQLDSTERILAITPVGYALDKQTLEEKLMTGFGLTHTRKPLSDIVSGFEEDKIPNWIKKSVEAARLAPSAINRQPWKFHVGPDSIIVSVGTPGPDFNVSKRLDCGIAMLHIEVSALYHGIKGVWDFLSPPDVARFRVIKRHFF